MHRPRSIAWCCGAIALLTVLLGGCAPLEAQVRSRAADDLRCPASEIHAVTAD